MQRLVAIILLVCLLPGLTPAQEAPATLVADRVYVRGDSTLVAEGNVEVLFGQDRLQAGSISYDQQHDLLVVNGPLTLTRGENTLILADDAALDPQMRNGILRGARLVLQQHLQLSATQIHRVDGRYTVLDRTVASSCQICSDRAVPLWQIRARRIIHDTEEKQLYFDHARFEVMGLPVAYLPRLRLPDPTLKRATGFLTPELKYSDRLGTGLKLPYFITLGDHADLTLTPYASTNRTRTLEYRFRRAYRNGEIDFTGAVSDDNLTDSSLRSYLFAEGRFDLPSGFELNFDLRTSSDDAYLLDYDYSDSDRLVSSIDLSRTRRDEHISAEILGIRSLRSSEDNQTLPTTIVDARYDRRFTPWGLGGIARLSFSTQAHHRRSGEDVIGRDRGQFSALVDWRRDWITRTGLVFAAEGALAFDHYGIGDDSTFDSTRTHATPFLATELRWPLIKSDARGVVQTLEPVVQIAWSPERERNIPNEDSRSPEFDEGNLFAFNRFPGEDAYEQGLRANLGLRWMRQNPSGWRFGVTGGRILREKSDPQFVDGAGLEGLSSDWLLGVQLASADNLSLSNRAVFDDDFSFTRNIMRLGWQTPDWNLSSSYVWQEANLLENRPNDSSEWVFDGSYQLHRNWRASADWRYDFINQRARRAGLGLRYRNECIQVDLSLSRRFTSSTSVEPTTNFGLSVSLSGFGAGRDGRSLRRSCTRQIR